MDRMLAGGPERRRRYRRNSNTGESGASFSIGRGLAAIRATTFILDDATGGWFRLGGDILTPVTEEARDVLAGSIDITEYQRYLVARLGGGGEEPESPVQPEPANLSPVLVAAGALGALLVLVGVTVWVRRPDDLED